MMKAVLEDPLVIHSLTITDSVYCMLHRVLGTRESAVNTPKTSVPLGPTWRAGGGK